MPRERDQVAGVHAHPHRVVAGLRQRQRHRQEVGQAGALHVVGVDDREEGGGEGDGEGDEGAELPLVRDAVGKQTARFLDLVQELQAPADHVHLSALPGRQDALVQGAGTHGGVGTHVRVRHGAARRDVEHPPGHRVGGGVEPAQVGRSRRYRRPGKARRASEAALDEALLRTAQADAGSLGRDETGVVDGIDHCGF